jgi:hypothetical protein
MSKTNTPVDAFVHLGVEIVSEGVASKGDKMLVTQCPFCTKRKMIVLSTGQWHCKVCHPEVSNLYGFMDRLIAVSLEATTEAEYAELSADRSIPIPTLKRHQLAKSLLTNKWLVPIRNQTGSMVNIYSWLPREPMIASPTCAYHPYGLHLLPQKKRPLWIAEGHWDYLVLDYLLRKVGRRQPEPISEGKGLGTKKGHEIDLLGWPASFKKEWIEKYCAGREVFLLFDNDPENEHGQRPGADAVTRFLKSCAEIAEDRRPSLVKSLKWPFEGKKGRPKDVRDVWKSKKIPSYEEAA